MSKKIIIFPLIVIAVAAGIYFYYKNEAKAPALGKQTSQQPAASSQGAAPAATSSDDYVDTHPIQGFVASDGQALSGSAEGGENAGSNVQVYETDFDGSKFTPATMNINVGDYIFFKNKSSGNFWPVAGSAATLASYKEFNPAAPIASGGEYKFQFTESGSFSFGDNLHQNAVFAVTVSGQP